MLDAQGHQLNRREVLFASGAAGLAVGTGWFSVGGAARAATAKRRILMYTKAETYEHFVVKRQGGQLSPAESIATELGAKNGFEVTCTKDGRAFLAPDFAKYDGFLFQPMGDPTKPGIDGHPPMPPEAKNVLLAAVANGKGFVGTHGACDTFHTAGYPQNRFQVHDRAHADPYIAMVGGEFVTHHDEQRAWTHVVDHAFPGMKGINDFGLHEEWYSLKNFAPDMHVIAVQETKDMVGIGYQRPNYPNMWARMEGRGRVFFTSLGHRQDVWLNPMFGQILVGALNWSVGNVDADTTPNLLKVAPHALEMPPEK